MQVQAYFLCFGEFWVSVLEVYYFLLDLATYGVFSYYIVEYLVEILYIVLDAKIHHIYQINPLYRTTLPIIISEFVNSVQLLQFSHLYKPYNIHEQLLVDLIVGGY